mmetsp:Transcript_28753/g.51157  ORF Transcript_28753/g.51157 Transcript_28753/m.51157 type:complete len:440 (-) Transcript_28753:13-1332(-)
MNNYLTVLAGASASVICGSLNVWGVLLPYLASYYHALDPDVTISTISSVYGYFALVEGVGWVFYLRIIDRIGVKLTIALGCGMASLAFFFGFIITNGYLFMVLFSLFYGFGLGITLLPAMNIVYNTFPHRKGLVSGFCSASFGISPMIYTIVVAGACNPDNISPSIVEKSSNHEFVYFEESVYSRVPYTMLLLSLLTLGFGIIAVACLSTPKKNNVIVPDVEEVEPLLKPNEAVQSPAKFEPTLKDIMKTPRFGMLLFILFAGMNFSVWVIVSYKTFAETYIKDDNFLNYVGIVGSIFNCIFRFIFPALMDYVSYRVLNYIQLSVQVVLSVVIYYSVTNQTAYLIVVTLIYITNASQFYPTAVATNIIYGKSGPKAFTIIAWGCILSSIAPSVNFALFVENFGYFSSFLVGGILSAAALLANSFISLEPQWPNDSLTKH